MGYAILGRLSIRQLQAHVRSVAQDSAAVALTEHAKHRMAARCITQPLIMECLRQGVIRRTPEPNASKGSLECRMERYCGGRNLAIVVAVSDENPNLIVVTAMVIRK